jgi:hypothetical protein
MFLLRLVLGGPSFRPVLLPSGGVWHVHWPVYVEGPGVARKPGVRRVGPDWMVRPAAAV